MMVVVAAMRGGAGMDRQEGGGEEEKKESKGRRKTARRKKAKGEAAPEGRSGGVGRRSPVSGSPSTLVWGRISVHFVFLHTV